MESERLGQRRGLATDDLRHLARARLRSCPDLALSVLEAVAAEDLLLLQTRHPLVLNQAVPTRLRLLRPPPWLRLLHESHDGSRPSLRPVPPPLRQHRNNGREHWRLVTCKVKIGGRCMMTMMASRKSRVIRAAKKAGTKSLLKRLLIGSGGNS